MAIRAAFIAVFDQVAGRKVAYQTPAGFVSAEAFDAVSEYVIPKPVFCGQVVSLAAFGSTVMGFPVCIEDSKYPRNALFFNACLIVGNVGPHEEEAYSRVVAKLAGALRTLEEEASHISEPTRRAALGLLLPRLVAGLNGTGRCTLAVDECNTIHLRLQDSQLHADAWAGARGVTGVEAHQVPVLVAEVGPDLLAADLALSRLQAHIDGRSTAATVASQAGLDLSWALALLSELALLGYVALIDCFVKTNVYVPTERLCDLARSERAQSTCVQYAQRAGRPLAHPEAALRLFSAFGAGPDGQWRTVAAAAAAAAAVAGDDDPGLDLRQAIQFGVLNGYIRRVHAFPRLKSAEGGTREALPSKQHHLVHRLPPGYLDGCHCEDEICVFLACGHDDLRVALEGVCTWVFRPDPDLGRACPPTFYYGAEEAQ
mmetsp:Transcript_4797/g.13293  ORF Transcript_4797/g.13293 Transcript_4797/m.13293 type:complete len:429 (+) Transcript_4797:79-1365(+)